MPSRRKVKDDLTEEIRDIVMSSILDNREPLRYDDAGMARIAAALSEEFISSIVPRTPTAQEIEAMMTESGGWTKKQLAAWGVSWPPPKGWRKRLEMANPCRVQTNITDTNGECRRCCAAAGEACRMPR